jgi:hypothetical protein
MAAHDEFNEINLHGKFAVAAIDFHETRIFALEGDNTGRPERVVAEDQDGYLRHLHTKANNVEGDYRTPSDEYWKSIAIVLERANAVVLLGHGNGKANASHQFIAYVEKHYSDLGSKILGDLRLDIDDLTDPQVLRIGQTFFDVAPKRDMP